MYQDRGLSLKAVIIKETGSAIGKEKQRLTEELDDFGIKMIEISDVSDKEIFGEMLDRNGVKEEECLMIAESEEMLELVKDLSIAVIGYQSEGSEWESWGADIVVQGFDEIDYYYLERIYQRKHHIPWKVIETERCFLREMALEDLEDMYELYSGEGMTDYMEGLYEDRQEEYDYSKAYIDNMYYYFGYGLWLVIEKSTGILIGRAGLNNQNIHGTEELEMGYAIAKEKQGKGYATEVCKGIIAYAKECLEADRVNCFIQKENTASIHMAEKLGFYDLEQYDLNGKPMERYVLDL